MLLRRVTRIAALAAALLAMPAGAVAQAAPTPGYTEAAVTTELRLFTYYYEQGFGPVDRRHCLYRYAFEYEPVANAVSYEWTIRERVDGVDTEVVYGPIPAPTTPPSTTWGGSYGPESATWTATPGRYFVREWDRSGHVNGPCPTDATQGGTSAMVKATALVPVVTVPDPAPAPNPAPTPPVTPTPAPTPTPPPAAKPAPAPIVGSLSKLAGAKKLTVVGADGTSKTLKVGGKLRLGDEVTLPKGVSATFKLARPKSVDKRETLASFTSAQGTSHRSKRTHKGASTTVVVTPAKAAKKK